MRIALVNDVAMTLEFLKLIVGKFGGYEVVWTANNGQEAVEKCSNNPPDIILMDLIMPVMNGVRATELIMKNTPCAILIVTASVGANASMVFEAMGYGALDVVKTPSSMPQVGGVLGQELLKKIDVIGRYIGVSSKPKKLILASKNTKREKIFPLLVIGSSTGGPRALSTILGALNKELTMAVVVVQHIDEHFAGGLAAWLSREASVPVSLAEEGEMPAPGRVLIAGREKHLVIDSGLTLRYHDEPSHIPYRPSVDVFFQSIAHWWPDESMAVLLTGMGSDGAIGLKALREKGWYTIAQNKESCVVFGMPKAAIALGAAKEVLALGEIANKISEQMHVKARAG